jgi:integrase
MASLVLERTKTPGVYRRGGRYVVTFRDPSGTPRKRFAVTYAEAKRLKAALSADVHRGEYREISRVTFADYAATWLDTYAGRTSSGIREETRAGYRRVLEQDAIPFFGRMRLAEIEARDLDALAAHIAARGVKPNTVRLALAPVKALLATAHQRGEIRSNPAAGYRTRYTSPIVDLAAGDEAREQVKALTEAELAGLLASVPVEWRLFFELLVQTGLRIGEAIELRWRDLDLGVGAGTLHVQRRFYRGRVAPPKTKYGRRKLSLSAGLVRSLWALRRGTHAGDDELVFTAERGARLDHSNLMRRVLKPAAVTAGLGEWVQTPTGRRADSWVGFHTFRHTCASMLFREGWNAAQVQRWLGHHKPSFTLDTYIHLLDEDVPPPTFFDTLTAGPMGNVGATQVTETGRNDEGAQAVEVAV